LAVVYIWLARWIRADGNATAERIPTHSQPSADRSDKSIATFGLNHTASPGFPVKFVPTHRRPRHPTAQVGTRATPAAFGVNSLRHYGRWCGYSVDRRGPCLSPTSPIAACNFPYLDIGMTAPETPCVPPVNLVHGI